MIGAGGSRAGISTPWHTLCAVLAIVAVLALGASESVAATPADRASTYAYLRAQYEYQQAILAGANGVAPSTSGFGASLETQCRGILAGAPETAVFRALGSSSERQRGESARERDQRAAVELELSKGEFAAISQLDTAAIATFTAAVTPLRWSDPRIAAGIAERLLRDRRTFGSIDANEVCTDMRAWVQSGYRKLAPRTREIETEENSVLSSLVPGPSIESLLKPYEGPVEHALIRKTRQLETGYLRSTFPRLARVDKRLRAALGIKEPKVLTEHKPIVLGSGKTRSGSKFEVTAEARQSHRVGCKLEVSVEYENSSAAAEGLVIESSSGSSVCVTGKAARHRPSLVCDGGRLTITQAVGPSVNRVRLLLADGHTATSPVVEIPARRGGPAGLYVQALGRRSSLPVSLTELDASGGVVRVQAITHRRCRAPREHGAPPVSLARGTTPAGTAFQIEGSHGIGFGPAAPPVELSLDAGEESGQEETIGQYSLEKTFPWSLGQECAPQEWAIVYGVLESPGASVTAVTPAGEVALTIVAIPARLHPNGVLAYGAFSQIPSRLIVRDAGGQLIATEDLTTRVTEHREYCEGYAEP
jgi:hypothetical protein